MRLLSKSLLSTFCLIFYLFLGYGSVGGKRITPYTNLESKPESFTMIDPASIPFVRDPQNGDISMIMRGTVIGVIMPLDKHGIATYSFRYFRENCWGAEWRDGNVSFVIYSHEGLDEKIAQLAGKKCLIIGTISDIGLRSPQHACDDAALSIQLQHCYIESAQ